MTTTSAPEPSAWRSLHLLKMMLRQIAAYSASLPALTPMPSLYKNAPTIQVRDACVSALVGRGCGLDSVLFFACVFKCQMLVWKCYPVCFNLKLPVLQFVYLL